MGIKRELQELPHSLLQNMIHTVSSVVVFVNGSFPKTNTMQFVLVSVREKVSMAYITAT